MTNCQMGLAGRSSALWSQTRLLDWSSRFACSDYREGDAYVYVYVLYADEFVHNTKKSPFESRSTKVF